MTFKTRRKLASACLVEIVILYHCLLHTTHPLHTPVKLHTLHFLIISGILPTSILPWQLQTLSLLRPHVNYDWFLKAWHKGILENALQATRKAFAFWIFMTLWKMPLTQWTDLTVLYIHTALPSLIPPPRGGLPWRQNQISSILTHPSSPVVLNSAWHLSHLGSFVEAPALGSYPRDSGAMFWIWGLGMVLFSHLKPFEVYSSDVSSTFTLFYNQSPEYIYLIKPELYIH